MKTIKLIDMTLALLPTLREGALTFKEKLEIARGLDRLKVDGIELAPIDGGKAALACLAGGLILAPYGMKLEGMAMGGLALMLGHDFPALLGFKGGKGIMSGCIIAFMLDWRVGLLILGVFAVVYFITWYVSLSSVLAALAFSVGFAVLHHDNVTVMLCGVFMGYLALYMHRSNISRLIKGQEKKTNLFGKGKKA